MADEKDKDYQSSLPTPPVQNPAQMPSTPAPALPVPGAATSAPLTGGGRKEEESKPSEETTTKTPPAPPQPRKPRQPTNGRPPAANQAPPAQPPAQPPPAHSPSFEMPPGALPVDNPALTSLLTQVFNSQRQTGQRFILMVLPEDDWPRSEEFLEVQQLVDRVKELLGTPVHLYAFMGHRLQITKGPNRYLQTPIGALPLFDIPAGDTAEEEDHGWMGPSMDKPEAPTSDSMEEDDEEELAEGDATPEAATVPAIESGEPAEEGDTPMFDGS